MKRRKPPQRKARLKSSRVPIRARKADPTKRRWAEHRTPSLTDWIKQQGCCLCASRPVDPAHVIPRARGSEDRNNVLPMCRRCHARWEGKNKELEANLGIDLTEMAPERMLFTDKDTLGRGGLK